MLRLFKYSKIRNILIKNYFKKYKARQCYIKIKIIKMLALLNSINSQVKQIQTTNIGNTAQMNKSLLTYLNLIKATYQQMSYDVLVQLAQPNLQILTYDFLIKLVQYYLCTNRQSIEHRVLLLQLKIFIYKARQIKIKCMDNKTKIEGAIKLLVEVVTISQNKLTEQEKNELDIQQVQLQLGELLLIVGRADDALVIFHRFGSKTSIEECYRQILLNTLFTGQQLAYKLIQFGSYFERIGDKQQAKHYYIEAHECAQSSQMKRQCKAKYNKCLPKSLQQHLQKLQIYQKLTKITWNQSKNQTHYVKNDVEESKNNQM